MKHNMVLYHGGAPGFRPGDLIEPHPTKHLDGCEWCASGADDNHAPEFVFATAERLYAKYYASKYGKGWLYIVTPEGEMLPSQHDPFETYQARSFRVVSVSERAVLLTMGERKRLQRLWKADAVMHGNEYDWLTERRLEVEFGRMAAATRYVR